MHLQTQWYESVPQALYSLCVHLQTQRYESVPHRLCTPFVCAYRHNGTNQCHTGSVLPLCAPTHTTVRISATQALYSICVRLQTQRYESVPHKLCTPFVCTYRHNGTNQCHTGSVLPLCAPTDTTVRISATQALYSLCVRLQTQRYKSVPHRLCTPFVCAYTHNSTNQCHTGSVLHLCAPTDTTVRISATQALYSLCVRLQTQRYESVPHKLCTPFVCTYRHNGTNQCHTGSVLPLCAPTDTTVRISATQALYSLCVRLQTQRYESVPHRLCTPFVCAYRHNGTNQCHTSSVLPLCAPTDTTVRISATQALYSLCVRLQTQRYESVPHRLCTPFVCAYRHNGTNQCHTGSVLPLCAPTDTTVRISATQALYSLCVRLQTQRYESLQQRFCIPFVVATLCLAQGEKAMLQSQSVCCISV